MKQKINLETWNRNEHYAFFSKMEEPFFGITIKINCTKAYQKAKELNVSFFTYYLHKTLLAVNAIENFRYRIIDNEIIVCDTIDASATILRADNTFGFSHMKFSSDMSTFNENVSSEIERIQTTTGLFTREYPENLIHFSSLPWVNFQSFSHARSFTFPDSCPKISFGKMTVSKKGNRKMSVSIHVHHGLVDGYHVGQFVELLQKLMDS